MQLNIKVSRTNEFAIFQDWLYLSDFYIPKRNDISFNKILIQYNGLLFKYDRSPLVIITTVMLAIDSKKIPFK